MGLKSPVFEITVTGATSSVILPETIVYPFLEKGFKRVFVKANFEDKEIEFHAAIQKRKRLPMMMFSKKNQKALGVFPNDYFQLQFFEDTSEYGVMVPEELEAVLQSDPDTLEIFESFTPSKQRGVIHIIKGCTNSQTRIDKSLLICENLKKGIRNNLMLSKSI
jgi:hypothetical protein